MSSRMYWQNKIFQGFVLKQNGAYEIKNLQCQIHKAQAVMNSGPITSSYQVQPALDLNPLETKL